MLAYVSFCCDSFRNMLLAHWHKEKKEVLGKWRDGSLQEELYKDKVIF